MLESSGSKSLIKYYVLCLLFSVLISLISYGVINQPNFDYQFHLTRIIGLAQSIRNFDFLPNLNFIFSYGTGYASPMFYGNWQLYPSAIVYIFTKNIGISYLFYGMLLNIFSTCASFYVLNDLSKNRKNSLFISCCVPLIFSIYGFGMTFVVPLAFLLIHSIYSIVIENKNRYCYLGIVTAMIIQTHILSTVTLAIYSTIFIVINLKLLNYKKIIVLLKGLFLALLLSIGFLIQFVEQSTSQVFFYKWNLRNFPVPSAEMFKPTTIMQTLTEQLNYGGFGSLVTPLVSLLIVTFFIFLLRMKVKSISVLSKTLIILSVSVTLLTSNLVAWKNLQHTFLGSFQYSYRLAFFIPVLILIIYIDNLSWNFVKYFFLSFLFFYVTSTILNIKEDAESYEKQNEAYHRAYVGDTNLFFSTIGNEYYTIDIDNASTKDISFKDFSDYSNVNISNVQSSYNSLEFDYDVLNPDERASISIPKIWYKGYTAKYSQGGVGSQPHLKASKFSQADLLENIQNKRNFSNDKIVNNGKIYLNFQKSGHVRIQYEKTFLQYIAFISEFVTWIILCVLLSNKYLKIKI